MTDGPEGASEKAAYRQEQAPNVLVSFLGNALTLPSRPVPVLIQAVPGQHIPPRNWPLAWVSLPHPALEVPVLCLGAASLPPSVLAPLSVALELRWANCGWRGRRWENGLTH